MVRLSLALIAVLLAGTAWPQTPAPRPPDGAMLSETPCQFISYAQASGFTRRHYPQDEYEAAVRSTTVECRRIRYASGGLSVVGFIVRPRGPATVRYPVIVYNRGGFRDIGMIDAWNLVDFYGFASQGFVVLASQYRGNDGGEGRDEVGGADVGDVMALSRLAASLPYADPSNLFLYGLSRGGMMSFLALKQGFRRERWPWWARCSTSRPFVSVRLEWSNPRSAPTPPQTLRSCGIDRSRTGLSG